MRDSSTPFSKIILAMRDFYVIMQSQIGVNIMEFYKILQDIMLEKNMGIPDVARACGLSDSTVRSIIDRKAKNVTLEVAFKMQRGLNVSLERLNGEKNGPTLNSEDKPMDMLDTQLINLARELTDDQKRLLLAQIKSLREQQ